MNKIIISYIYIFLLSSCFFNFELEKGALVYKNNCQNSINLYTSENARDVISIEPGKSHIELFIIGDNIVPEEAFFIKNKKREKFHIENSKNNYILTSCYKN